jgi:hypothetical protein
MPIVIGAVDPRVEINDPGGCFGIGIIEQQQPHPGAVFGEDAEIGAAGDKGRTQREAPAAPGKRGSQPALVLRTIQTD